jgi:hypothetical protein
MANKKEGRTSKSKAIKSIMQSDFYILMTLKGKDMQTQISTNYGVMPHFKEEFESAYKTSMPEEAKGVSEVGKSALDKFKEKYQGIHIHATPEIKDGIKKAAVVFQPGDTAETISKRLVKAGLPEKLADDVAELMVNEPNMIRGLKALNKRANKPDSTDKRSLGRRLFSKD